MRDTRRRSTCQMSRQLLRRILNLLGTRHARLASKMRGEAFRDKLEQSSRNDPEVRFGAFDFTTLFQLVRNWLTLYAGGKRTTTFHPSTHLARFLTSGAVSFPCSWRTP